MPRARGSAPATGTPMRRSAFGFSRSGRTRSTRARGSSARSSGRSRWRRAHPLLQDTDALRLVHAEADGLPGLTVDRYADWLAVRTGTPAMLRRAPRVAEILTAQTGARGAWLRSEGAAGAVLAGDVPVEPIEIDERGRRYAVDLRHGQKTGFYLDQRDARDLFARLAPRRARARPVRAHRRLRGGGAGGRRGARWSRSSRRSRRSRLLARNAPGCEIVSGDVNEFLRADTRAFDLVSVDPPPFAKRKRDVGAACRAYKDLNLRVLRARGRGRARAHLHLLAPRRAGAVPQGRVRRGARRGPRSAGARRARRAAGPPGVAAPPAGRVPEGALCCACRGSRDDAQARRARALASA